MNFYYLSFFHHIFTQSWTFYMYSLYSPWNHSLYSPWNHEALSHPSSLRSRSTWGGMSSLLALKFFMSFLLFTLGASVAWQNPGWWLRVWSSVLVLLIIASWLWSMFLVSASCEQLVSDGYESSITFCLTDIKRHQQLNDSNSVKIVCVMAICNDAWIPDKVSRTISIKTKGEPQW